MYNTEEIDVFGFPKAQNECIDFEKEKMIIQNQKEAERIERQNRIQKLIEDNTPKKGVVTKEVWDVPIPSHNNYLRDKNADYTVYSGISLVSNFGGMYNMETQRYIYKNKLDFKEMAEVCNISESTVKRSFNKLKNVKIEGYDPLIATENTPNGVVYKLNYGVDDKYYVTIPNDILQYLIKTSNSNMIKLYVFLKVQLKDGSKQMQREFIADHLGFNSKSSKALDNVSEMTTDLVAKGLLIKTERFEFFYDEINKREIPKKLVTYELTTDEYWRYYKATLTKKVKNTEKRA